MIEPPNAAPLGPFCDFCRRKFIFGLKRAAANSSRYRSEYGLLLSEYGQLFAYQNGLCAICHDRRESDNSHGADWSLVVDHDHGTGEVRGLLCRRCNSAIGLFRDDPALLAGAIIYLTTRLPLHMTQSEIAAAD